MSSMSEEEWLQRMGELEDERGDIVPGGAQGGVVAKHRRGLGAKAIPPNHIPAVVAIIHDRADPTARYAGVRMEKHGWMPEFPGGRREAEESLEDALRREVREELGVEIDGIMRVFSMPTPGKDGGSPHWTTFYSAIIASGEMQSSEGQADWFTREELTTRGRYAAVYRTVFEVYDLWLSAPPRTAAGSGVIHPESHHPAGTAAKSYHPKYAGRWPTPAQRFSRGPRSGAPALRRVVAAS